MSEEMYQQRELEKQMGVESGAQAMTAFAASPPTPNGALTDISDYQRGVVYREWYPDKDQYPELKHGLWIRVRALTGTDQAAIQQAVNQFNMDNANLERIDNQIRHLKPDPRVDRNEATLKKMSLDDEQWRDNEEGYYTRREELQAQIDAWMRVYADQHQQHQADKAKILAKPKFYDCLRDLMFLKVIEDHTIGIRESKDGPLVKFDFETMELTDEATGSLQEFLWDVIKKESRAGRKKSKR